MCPKAIDCPFSLIARSVIRCGRDKDIRYDRAFKSRFYLLPDIHRILENWGGLMTGQWRSTALALWCKLVAATDQQHDRSICRIPTRGFANKLF